MTVPALRCANTRAAASRPAWIAVAVAACGLALADVNLPAEENNS